ncbi:MAG: hypothetical protein ACYTKD_26695 [Planctomycetota bacterium]|jgi:hypothetical protein
MLCFAAGYPPPDEGLRPVSRLHAIYESLYCEVSPDDPEELETVWVLGVFLVESKRTGPQEFEEGQRDDEGAGAYLDVIHPETVANIEPVELRPAPDDGLERVTPRDIVEGNGALTFLAKEAPLYFRLNGEPGCIRYATRGAFLPNRKGSRCEGAWFAPLQVDIEEVEARTEDGPLPPLAWSGLRPLSCFRLGPIPYGSHHFSVMLQLPVCNIMEWYNIAENRFWVDSPDSLVSRLCRALSLDNGDSAGWRTFLNGFKKRICPSGSYYVSLLPREWNEGVPDCEVIDSGAVPLWEDGGRRDVRTYGRYKSRDPFRLLVDPKAKLMSRQLHYKQAVTTH